MNYRHAFHAGNFADVVKHATLARIITYLKRKPAPIRVIDTHAGIGVYDLAADEATRTGEWRDGIGRLLAADMPEDMAALLAPYLDMVRALNDDGDPRSYPGSPELARQLCRPADGLTLVELHPQDAETLAARYRRDRRVKVVELDGWLALGAFLPPKEKRGLVLIDPAFEEPDEYDRLTRGLIKACGRWPSGIYCAWYPIKDVAKVEGFHAAVAGSGIRRVLRIEMTVASPDADGPLAGCGLLVVNPPFTLHDDMARLLPWLTTVLGRGAGAGHRVDWLVPE